METKKLTFGPFFWRITSSHMITYFLAGLFAYYFLGYESLFKTEPLSNFMRPLDSPWIMAGPSLQVFRGIIFSIVLWPFTEVFLKERSGWIKLWILILGLSVLSTTGPAPGSIEGMIYTTVPIRIQFIGYIEVVPQTLLFSYLLVSWYHHPRKIWNVISVVFVSLIVFFGIMALAVLSSN